MSKLTEEEARETVLTSQELSLTVVIAQCGEVSQNLATECSPPTLDKCQTGRSFSPEHGLAACIDRLPTNQREMHFQDPLRGSTALLFFCEERWNMPWEFQARDRNLSARVVEICYKALPAGVRSVESNTLPEPQVRANRWEAVPIMEIWYVSSTAKQKLSDFSSSSLQCSQNG